MKTYQFAGKTVKAVKETDYCVGCVFKETEYPFCVFGHSFDRLKKQRDAGMPDCIDEKIIFKIVTDENK